VLEVRHGLIHDGTPVVFLNPNRFVTKETIVHELFHLKMIAEGSPHITFSMPIGSKEVEKAKLSSLFGHLRSPIQHSMFFP
jgi:hypothetical protein